MLNWIRQKLNRAQPTIYLKETKAGPVFNGNYRAAYDQIEVVHRAVGMIISACVEIPFKISDSRTTNKINRLLNSKPNPFEDRIKFFRRAYLDFILDGNIFIYYDGNFLYLLPSNDVEIIADERMFIKAYRYNNRGGRTSTTDFDSSEIIHIRDDNDDSIYRGKSRLRSLTNIINIYNSLLQFQQQFFKNNAIPGIVLTTDSILNQKFKERLLEVWKANYSTIMDGARNPAILDGGLKIDKFSEINFQNLDFENSVDRLEQDMAKALGVPYVLLKSGNNANISANQVLFYEHTILPIVSMMASAFQHFFNSAEIQPDKASIVALQPDLKTQSSYYSSLVSTGIITPDEARIRLGFEPLETPDTSAIRVPRNITGSATNPSIGGRPEETE